MAPPRACVIRLVVVTVLAVSTVVQGHGRLIEPPSRSSAWRYGFNTPPNYNDHEIYCGGYSRQWQINGGKCGPCGDPFDSPQPRANEEGGTYGKGIIVRKYQAGASVQLGIELTANHMGYFQFRLCPHNNPKVPVTNACLDRHVLPLSDGNGTKYFPGSGSGKFYATYTLPADVTCSQCVLQWRYVAANNWGTCENGMGAVGCGPQEEFRACADVAISTEEGFADDVPLHVPEYTEAATSPRPTKPAVNTKPTAPTKPTKPTEVNPVDDDYNEVDVDGHVGEKPGMEDHTNHAGHVVAITFAFLLTLIVMMVVIGYFYVGKDRIRTFFKRHVGHWDWSKQPVSPSTPSQKVLNISAPVLASSSAFHKGALSIIGPMSDPPVVPPRRNRPSSVSQQNLANLPTAHFHPSQGSHHTSKGSHHTSKGSHHTSQGSHLTSQGSHHTSQGSHQSPITRPTLVIPDSLQPLPTQTPAGLPRGLNISTPTHVTINGVQIGVPPSTPTPAHLYVPEPTP